MADVKETYDKVAQGSFKLANSATKFFREFFPFLILILNLIVTVIARLFVTKFQNPFTPDFFISLATNLLTTMFCYSIFVKYGEKSEKLFSSTYASNLERWGKLSSEVRVKRSESFIVYCRRQVELERQEIRHSYILNHTMIDINKYESDYKGLTPMKLDKLVEVGEISKRDAKYIKLANKTPRVAPINPLLVLCGVYTNHINDVGREKFSFAFLAIIARPVTLFATTVCVTMIKGYWRGITDASVVFEIVYSLFTIVLSSVFGYTSGAFAAEKEHNRIKGRIYFIERFISLEKEQETKVQELIKEQEVIKNAAENNNIIIEMK